MQLQQLKYFVAVIEHQSFSKAAASVFISQPSLSQAIQALETELGFTLLNRTRTGSLPTDLGRLVYDDAKQILALLDTKRETWQAVWQQRKALNGTVRIACMPAVYPLLTEHILKNARQTYPNLNFTVLEARNNILFSYLLGNEADMVLCGFMDRKREQVQEFACEHGIETVALKRDAYKIALSTRNPLAQKNNLTMAEALQLPLACYSDSDDVAEAFFEKHFEQKLRVGYNSFEKIIRAALGDKSASVLPQLSTLCTLKLDSSYKGELRFMTAAGFCLPFTHYLCYRKNYRPTPEFTAITDMIRQIFANLPKLD